jgi:hypothetical protein
MLLGIKRSLPILDEMLFRKALFARIFVIAQEIKCEGVAQQKSIAKPLKKGKISLQQSFSLK